MKVLLLNFRNSKWRTQYGDTKFEESLDLVQNWCTEVSEGADHNLAIRFSTHNGGQKFEEDTSR